MAIPRAPEKSKSAKLARRMMKRSERQKPESKPAQLLAAGPPEATATTEHRFPIVGIGASAGGLEALEQFFRHVPKDTGMAFVVVQHQDPTHKGMFVELLQRNSGIPVVQAKDGLKVEADHVYVIPPNKDMSLLHGTLHLLPQAAPRGLNLPIDFFFRSLAEDQRERSIGVILSGMGSDGTLGLRAIKEKAGAAFVQALESAKFSGMPRSVIDAGLADVVAPVEDLPEKIVSYRKHATHITVPDTLLEDKGGTALDKIYVLLRSQTGNDFSLYKKSTIYRRIERRMGLHQIDNIANYVRYLRENPREIDLLFKELLIGVTSFFRDPSAWEHLKNVVPAIMALRAASGIVRAWVPGCSTGEEAYSLAIVLREAAEPLKTVKSIAIQVFATDLDREAIEKARHGFYPDNIAADVSPERLRRYFVREEQGYRVSKEIREMVVFAPQNIIMDPPFTKLDILCCRNLLIYLSPELQKKLIPLFHYSLNPSGVLFLGSAETVSAFTSMFTPLDGKTRIYRKLVDSATEVPVDFPTSVLAPPLIPPGNAQQENPEPERPIRTSLQTLADRELVQRFAPLGVLCNSKGEVLYISSRAGKYFEPPVGKTNVNIISMARDGLRHELNSAFATALREDHPVTAHGVKVASNGGTQTVDVIVQKLTEPKELRGTVMVVIQDVKVEARAKAASSRKTMANPPRIAHLQLELQQAREEVQTTREEMQTSQEELKSSNEELQSTNEELQSTNEELTTSKEEMQSLNEELQTVNQELESKVDQLSRSNNDMKNLLNSTDIATLFLDGELRVRRFTTQTAKIIKLITADAGRPITDIASDLEYPDLVDDAREVLRTLVFREKEVGTRDGRWFKVRIMPYRTLDNVIDGVVITFNDVTGSRELEIALREQASQLKQMADSLPNLVWGARPDGSWDYVSRQWQEYTGASDADLVGSGWLEQVHPDDRERVREQWRAAVKGGKRFDLEFRIKNLEDAYRWFKTRSIPIRDSQGSILKWYGLSTDVDALKRAEEARRQSLESHAAVLENISEGFLALDKDLKVTFVNSAAEQMLERNRKDVVGRKLFDAFPEIRGSTVDQKFKQAMRDQAPATVEASFANGPKEALYNIRVYPQNHSEGISVFLQPKTDRRFSQSAEKK